MLTVFMEEDEDSDKHIFRIGSRFGGKQMHNTHEKECAIRRITQRCGKERPDPTAITPPNKLFSSHLCAALGNLLPPRPDQYPLDRETDFLLQNVTFIQNDEATMAPQRSMPAPLVLQ